MHVCRIAQRIAITLIALSLTLAVFDRSAKNVHQLSVIDGADSCWRGNEVPTCDNH